MLECVLKVNDVSINVNLNKILKSCLGCKKLNCTKTSSDYLDCSKVMLFIIFDFKGKGVAIMLVGF